MIFTWFPGFPFDASTLLSIDPELCRRVDFAQGGESFDLAQDREPVERPVERLVERPVEPRVSPGMTAFSNQDTVC